MTHNRLGFNQFLSKEIKNPSFILDTNILIAYFFDDHRQHELVKDFLELLDKKFDDASFYSTVTTKSEFLDFRRRQHLTESLLDLVDEVNRGRTISAKSKAQIDSKKGLLISRRKQKINEENLPIEDEMDIELNLSKRVFYDNEIKEIKKSFRARTVQKEAGWIEVCKSYLRQKLEKDEELIEGV